jgi:hypothetical protein
MMTVRRAEMSDHASPNSFAQPVRDPTLAPGQPGRRLWVWCLHCERTYEAIVPDGDGPGNFFNVGVPLREVGGEVVPLDDDDPAMGPYLRCPFGDCDGTPIDVHSWAWVRRANPGYPAVPEVGRRYALYPPPRRRRARA